MPVIDHHNILFCLFDSLSLENFDIHERDGALPSLSRLREGGVFFNHCYAPCPQSSPARASVFTGLDPAVHGVWTNGVELPATKKTFVQLLMGSGYSSYLAGRYQLAGVSRWTTEKILATDFDEIDWAHGPLHRSRQNAYLNWFKENAPEEYAKVFASQADPDSTSVSQQQIAAYSELPDELSFNHWIGECVKAKINSTASEKPLITVAGFSVGDAMGGEPRAGVDSELLSKDALIQADSAIGKIVELLQESGRLDDTVIVVASARGNSNPVDSKMQMGEGSIRVPLLFSQANFEKMTVEEPVSTVDIAPTVLNVSNVTYGPRMQGRPLPGACSSAEVPRNWAITRLRAVIDTVNREWCTSFCINNMKLLVRHGNRKRQGTTFENMYITAPSCAPSRASLFSGVYPHTNGVFRNDEPWNYCWVKDLAEGGYRTVNVGKMHTMPVEGPFGFHERHVVENKDRDHPNLPFYLDNWDKAYFLKGLRKPSRVSQREREDYDELLGAWVWEHDEIMHPDVFVGQMACWWLDRYPGDDPFFLQVGLPGPHPPYDPTEEYLEMYNGREMPSPISPDPESQPEAMQELRKFHLGEDADGIVHLADPTPEQSQRQRMHYYANVTMIDKQVGAILDTLEKRGTLDNTIIIFTSDHGDCLGDHGHSQKWNMYEPTVRVPALVSWPGHIPEGQRVSDLVALFDLGPTILEYAGIEPPAWMEATSLQPYLGGTPEGERQRVYAEHSNDALLTGTRFMTMIRDGTIKLVHFVDSENGQLFDLGNDPDEQVNLWHDPDYAEKRAYLINEILNWRMESSLHTQGFIEACMRGEQAMNSPPSTTARGQHREGSRL